MAVAGVGQQLGVTEQTYYRWRKEYGGLSRDQAKRLRDAERGIVEIDGALRCLAQDQVGAETVQAGLERLGDVLEVLRPFEREELIRLVLGRAEVGDRRIALEIYPMTAQELAMPQSHSRSEAPNWLLGQVSGHHYYRTPSQASP